MLEPKRNDAEFLRLFNGKFPLENIWRIEKGRDGFCTDKARSPQEMVYGIFIYQWIGRMMVTELKKL